MKYPKSSIPPNSIEKPVGHHKQKGTPHSDRVTDCFLHSVRVGQRVYNREGVMVLETPMKEGLKHGWEFTWDDDGKVLLVEPYVKGKIHGTAKQYGRDGKVIGTYTLIHGTGFDIWRQENEDETVFVSEIHSLQDGFPHGYEWHFVSSQEELWHERYWHRGKIHGIERIWNRIGKLSRGFPAFYVLDQKVSRQNYLKLAQTDKTLPPYWEEDNLPDRNFPQEIQGFMA